MRWLQGQKARVCFYWLLFWHRSGLWPNESLRQRDEWLAQVRKKREEAHNRSNRGPV